MTPDAAPSQSIAPPSANRPPAPFVTPFPWRIFTLVAAVTVGLLLIIGYSFRLGFFMAANYAPQMNAAQNIRIEATLAHLWLEEIISGDTSESFATVQAHLQRAEIYTDLLLNGGEYGDSRYLPLSNAELLRQVQQIKRELQRFRAITEARYQALGSDRAGSTIDAQFDSNFRHFSASAEAVAGQLKRLIRDELSSFRLWQILLMLLCLLLGAGLIVLLCNYELKQHRHLQQIYRANQKLDQLSLTDPLTGIPNRRDFDQCLKREWQRALRERQPLTLVMLDIDYFKAYNDHLGHPQGDLCLQMIARTLQQLGQRSVDLVARYGGEEFALILPNTQGVEQQIERIRSAVEALNIPHPHSQIGAWVTASIGYCTALPHPQLTAEQLLQAADNALYKAKAGGRNRAEHEPLKPAQTP
ncbi:MAG TPA: diguanylate cyclase [Motiliproteus sp.]